MKKKRALKIALLVLTLVGIIVALILAFGPKQEQQQEEIKEEEQQEIVEEVKEVVDIFDMTTTDRPYAVVVNNTPVAVKVQEGLKQAYLIYEFPTEGNTSRLMALYKTKKDVTIGTIRSIRHNFIDYAHENGAILIGFGWSHYAQDELELGGTDYVNGIVHSGPFWRDNKENLAYEHTVYTTLNKLKDYASKYNQQTDVKPPYSMNVSDVELDIIPNVKDANDIVLNYGPYNKEHFIYDSAKKVYTRNFNDEPSLDHETKEQVTVKNIIITEISSHMCSDNHYWDLEDVGSGKGYLITNGKAVPINWSKSSRNAATKYTFEDGSEIEVSDGITWISLFIKGKEVQIS